MKLGYIAIVTLLILQSYFVAVVGCNACLNKNPAMPLLKSQGVTVFEKPVFIKEIHNSCKAEWVQYGSCCEQNSARSYAEGDKQRTMKVLDGVDTFSKDVLAKIDQLFNHVKNILQQKKAVPDALKPLFERLRSSPAEYSREAMLPITDEITRKFGGCRDFLLSARGSSVCNLCSGRSDSSFFKTKALVSDAVCSQALEKCGSIFTLPFLLTGKLDIIFSTLSNYKIVLPANPSQHQRDAQSAFAELQKAVLCRDRKRVLELAQAISVGHTRGKVLFCEKLLRIYEQLYFVEVNRELQLALKVLSLLNKDLELLSNDSREQVWSLHLRSAASRRLLNAALPTFDSMFTGDVIVVPPVPANVDSAYSSFLGAVGTNPVFSTHPLVVLNLTDRFP